jgi:acetyl esterase/lipase
VLLIALATSCVKDPVEAPLTRELLVETNVYYGPDERQRMAVTLPEGRDEQTPIVILIHGGAWTSGSKEDLAGLQQVLLANQIGSISIDYRFVSATHHVDGLMADVGQALAAIAANAHEWGIRSDGYQLFGASAGAHMALLYAYHFQQPNEVSAVISAAGPTTFSDEFLALAAATGNPLKAPIEAMAGAPIETPYSPRFAAASPLTHVADAVPTLLIHGKADLVVPYQMSAALDAALKAEGKTAQLITLPDAGHDLFADPVTTMQVLNDALTWIKAQG